LRKDASLLRGFTPVAGGLLFVVAVAAFNLEKDAVDRYYARKGE